MTQIASGDSRDDNSMTMAERVDKKGGGIILYDGNLVDHPRPEWFERRRWPALANTAGRGRTVVTCADQEWILRHYYRGGLVGRFVRDSFLWTGVDRTRSFREWRLLARLHQLGLPVPRPVAARVVRSDLRYVADLLTVRIPGVSSLAERIARGPLDTRIWHGIGSCIARFHAVSACHADLNAHNIQLSDRGEVYVLDFDRSRIMQGNGAWQQRNLERLHRSLSKIGRTTNSAFRADDWQALLTATAPAPAQHLPGSALRPECPRFPLLATQNRDRVGPVAP